VASLQPEGLLQVCIGRRWTGEEVLLESNVRDSLGLNSVNEDILSTLRYPGPSDFLVMNNGITILGTRASVTGKVLSIDDVQIVNGLQTTETVARYFREGGDDENRSVLVKVVVSQDASVRDEIIKATNNQTSIEHASLRATDKLQRDIEDIFEQHGGGLHYERRRTTTLTLEYSGSDSIATLHRWRHDWPPAQITLHSSPPQAEIHARCGKLPSRLLFRHYA